MPGNPLRRPFEPRAKTMFLLRIIRSSPDSPIRAILLLAVFLALPCDPGHARTLDAIKEFKSWFKKYRHGDIDLYQKCAVPIRADDEGGLRYFRTDEIRRMDSLLQALADRNDLAGARLLVDAATFHFDRRGDVEIRKHSAQQPWALRSHAVDALTKITNDEALEWLKKNLLESRSLWDSGFRRTLGVKIFATAADSPAQLVPAVNDRDPRVREEALRSLGRRGTIREIDAVFLRFEDGEEAVRIAAIEAIRGILANDRNMHPSLFYNCLERIKPLLCDSSWSVMDATLSFLENNRSVRSIPVLIETLGKVAAGTGRYSVRSFSRIIEVLRSLTGVTSPGSDPKAWEAWWKLNGKTFVLPPEKAMRAGYQTGAAHFFSIPVNSDSVLFILDISGSMRSPLILRDSPGSEETKLERAHVELTRTLGDLHPEIHFNIFLFNDEIKRFSKEFKTASKLNVTSAELFFKDSIAKGGTNLFDTLNAALSLENVGTVDSFGEEVACDTIFLLSDGVPSTGQVIDPEEIIDIISRANRSKRIRIHTIYVGTEHSPFMEEFAHRNFGRYAHIR
jgi:hypothetical protein